tara:strand:- start:260 stop:880 length:621 start_codon:yes stop_codon:yes gene_type:complete
MRTTQKFKIASYFLKFLMGLSIITAGVLAFIYFHSMVSPEKYANLTVNDSRNLIFNLNVVNVPESLAEWKSTKQLFHYNLLDNYSKFTVVWPTIISFITFFLILLLFERFFKKTTNYRVFFEGNIKMIDKIIKLILFLFLFNFIVLGYRNPMSMVFNEGEVPHFITSEKISFSLFIYYPIALILFVAFKEVFKRGQELKQENDLTI